ncbi:hypothetical protein MPTK2_8g01740 [Marchantia polymorpha subsp. ruderalis]
MTLSRAQEPNVSLPFCYACDTDEQQEALAFLFWLFAVAFLSTLSFLTLGSKIEDEVGFRLSRLPTFCLLLQPGRTVRYS